MVHVVVDLVVVDGQVVTVVVGIEAVRRVVVHLVPPPVSLLVTVRVDSEMVVVDVRVVDVAVNINLVENFGIAAVGAVPSNLAIRCDIAVSEGVVYMPCNITLPLFQCCPASCFWSQLFGDHKTEE